MALGSTQEFLLDLWIRHINLIVYLPFDHRMQSNQRHLYYVQHDIEHHLNTHTLAFGISQQGEMGYRSRDSLRDKRSMLSNRPTHHSKVDQYKGSPCKLRNHLQPRIALPHLRRKLGSSEHLKKIII